MSKPIAASRASSLFEVFRSIRQDEHRITEHGGGLFKAYAVFAPVDLRLVLVPDEQIAIDGVAIIHA